MTDGPSGAVRVFIVDEQPLIRDGIRALLSIRPEVEVVGEASDGREAVARTAALHPDVVLMDLKMPHMDGVAAIRRLCIGNPNVRVIVLATFADDEVVFAGLRAGAAGYLLKDASIEQLLLAIASVARGHCFLQPCIAARVVAEFARLAPRPAERSGPALSEREHGVLWLLARGASNKEIGAALGVAEGTVKNRMTTVLAKLGVTDRTAAALKARDLGLV